MNDFDDYLKQRKKEDYEKNKGLNPWFFCENDKKDAARCSILLYQLFIERLESIFWLLVCLLCLFYWFFAKKSDNVPQDNSSSYDYTSRTDFLVSKQFIAIY
ncbi:hypothetical protein EF87_03620 [Bacillus amyloliquefaciens]|nr:hypothetical protein EF87_03620 [Bacillus amyloliquefaciens]